MAGDGEYVMRLCLERGFSAVVVVSITVWQAREPGAPLERAERPMLEPAVDELVLEVLHCGLCHSDLSMLENHWGVSSFPLVPGHEVVGRVVQVGEGVDPGVIGQLRGLGWISGSCSLRAVPKRHRQSLSVAGGHDRGPPGRLRQPCHCPSRLGHPLARGWIRPWLDLSSAAESPCLPR